MTFDASLQFVQGSDESSLDYRLLTSEPGEPAGRLLDALIRTTESVPSGESLSAAFYYLRNERLCNALADARDRGVKVRILVSGRTHVQGANNAALATLRKRGFGRELCVRYKRNLGLSRMHLKLFLASATKEHKNVILTGTYNPSGNDVAELELMKRIGDQDRGYNYILELRGAPALYASLEAEFNALHDAPRQARLVTPTTTTRHFVDVSSRALPTRDNPLLEYLSERLGSNLPGRLRIAASHLSHRGTIDLLGKLQDAGHRVEVISHDSQRRFPARAEDRLRSSCVEVRRYVHPERYPMHCKFILCEYPAENGRLERDLFLGSMNLNFRSYYLNDDLFLRISNGCLYDEFSQLWDRISADVETMTQQ